MHSIYCSGLIAALAFVLGTFVDQSSAFALSGKFAFQLDQEDNNYVIPNRGLYNGTKISVRIDCNGATGKVRVGWLLRLSQCIDEFYINSERHSDDVFAKMYDMPYISVLDKTDIRYMRQNVTEFDCTDAGSIDLKALALPPIVAAKTQMNNEEAAKRNLADVVRQKRSANASSDEHSARKSDVLLKTHDHSDDESIAETWMDGAYLFMLHTEYGSDNKDYSLNVQVSFKYGSGYLSANDWPFLPFYALMCGIYSVFALFWLVCSLCYWRDLLRIQIWIGGVILLGLMEKAAYLAEYEQIDKTGFSVRVPMVVAEIISCMKRSLARMLVIVVSLGFGIVKPRLGPAMQKVVALGALYFIFASVDGVFKIIGRKEDTDDSKAILAGVPLVFIDVSICYWILTNLQQTMRTLRLRRNISKLTLYRHFTNTLIFCVFSSVVFMIWSLSRHRFVACLKEWKELWLDEGFWHILFSFVLFVIMLLWRPSANSQRFAFSPLMDNDDDDDDFDGEDQENEIFDSVKMRTKNNSQNMDAIVIQSSNQVKNSIEDDLKWVEENVPVSMAETALPALADSDEEKMNTQFEISKMD